MTGPLGNSEFCFPRISMFPSTSSRETLRFSGNKIHCSPRDQSLSVYCSMANINVAHVPYLELFLPMLKGTWLTMLFHGLHHNKDMVDHVYSWSTSKKDMVYHVISCFNLNTSNAFSEIVLFCYYG